MISNKQSYLSFLHEIFKLENGKEIKKPHSVRFLGLRRNLLSGFYFGYF